MRGEEDHAKDGRMADAATENGQLRRRLEALEAALAAREERIRELESALATLETDTERWCRETRLALDELVELTRRQQEVLRDTMAATATLAAVRASNTWRLAAALESLRTRVRRVRIRYARALRFGRGPGTPRVPAAVRRAPLGVNVAGYISAESGMGEAARASIRALELAGIPVALNDVPSGQRTHDTTYTNFTTENPHPFNLVHLNADNMVPFERRQGVAYFRNRYTIGYWFWELARFRDDWYPAFRVVQEVWVASRFVQAAVGALSPVPVLHMPPGLLVPDAAPVGRDHFGIPPEPVVFLFMFDVSSQLERKNPLGVLRAFRRAELGSRALLVLKFTNAFFDPAAVRRLHEEAAGLNVLLLDGFMDRRELTALLNVADCYVSLHRSEGFGLTMAEAMALGKPVIATAYSANMDFMTPDNSYLVDYRLVALDRNYGPYLRGFEWADADVAHAGRHMRHVVEHREHAVAVGQRAARDVMAALSLDRAAERIKARLTALRTGVPGWKEPSEVPGA